MIVHGAVAETSAVQQSSSCIPATRRGVSVRDLVLLALLTLGAFVVMGYHPGLEDDAFYLAAIKKNLNPSLFPHDSEFFRLQFQATIFDKLIALSVRVSHVPLAWMILLWQLAAVFLLLNGCWRISRRCFLRPEAQWAAVALVAVLLTLPVSGTAINIADQYLHPRTLATAAILAAVVAVIDRRLWLAGALLVVATLIHALMACFGISFCAFLVWNLRASKAKRQSTFCAMAAGMIPLGWMFDPASDAWRQAAATRGFYFVGRWHWYEWLGVFAPLVLVYIFRQFLRSSASRGDGPALAPLTSALLGYGVFQTIVGLALVLPPSLERVRPFEPMRYLHLVYLLFFLCVGGFLGNYVLGRRLHRWLLLFLPLGAVMYSAQRQLYPASAHLELPTVAPRNAWLQAFAWIRENTPTDSLFALDPHYTTLPGEDYHAFRALAERSALADYDKDGGMAARVPRLAPRWLKEVTALNGWRSFEVPDFEHLQKEFGINWFVFSRTDKLGPEATDHAPPGMLCPYENQQVRVCRLYLE